MNSITNLQDVSIDKIETDIMSVLYANMDVKFSQYTLFNKVLEDKYDGQYSSQIHSNFKSRFLIVLRNLMSKYDDIKVSKDNGFFWVVCVSDSESEKPIKFERWDKPIKHPITLDTTDYAHMYNYIYDTNPNDFINWSDPWNGNTIFHELVLTQNKTLIEKLLLQDQFNFMVKNTHGKTPIELPTSQEITDMLTKNLLEKLNFMNEKINFLLDQNKNDITKYDIKVKYLESDEYKNKVISDANFKDIILIKSSKFYQNYKMYILSALICLIAIKYFI